MWRIGICILAAGLTGCVEAPQSGAALYRANCAGCHGDDGRGGGPDAPDMPVAPSDLTMLAAENGGVFPADAVMAQVYGYAGRHQLGGMPEFGPLLEGKRVLWTTAEGDPVPTPERLVALTRYLETLQTP